MIYFIIQNKSCHNAHSFGINVFRHFCILFVFVISSGFISGQSKLVDDKQIQPDSLYLIQFIALRDTARTFQELSHLGTVIKEYLPVRDVCRYSIGHFPTKILAQRALDQITLYGFHDAFIRKSLSRLLLPSEFISIEQSDGLASLDKSEDEPSQIALVLSGDSIVLQEVLNITSDIQDTVKPLSIENGVESFDSNSVNISLLYTGKSLGVLGNTRFQSEHELATEYAIDKEILFKLVSHACWRARGLTVFLPSDEPDGHELDLILKERKNWEVIESYPALKTNNVVMFRDPDRTDFDMLGIILRNKRTKRVFPEMEQIEIKLYRTIIEDDKECFIVEESNALWPLQQQHWSKGEINRLDFGKTGRLFELPLNQGNFGSRIKVLEKLDIQNNSKSIKTIKVDLGHRNGDFNVSSRERAQADIMGLNSLGYTFLCPFEFELSLGADFLQELKTGHPQLTWLATNISSPNHQLFSPYEIVEFNGVKVGLIGMIDPQLETNLPGKILKAFKFTNIIDAAQKAVEHLLDENVDAIIALSNMDSDQNAILSERVYGIDVIASDLSNNGSPFNSVKEIKLPKNAKRGLGRPYHIANNYDYGVAIGKLDLEFIKDTNDSKASLITIREKNYPVNDRVESDTFLVNSITSDLHFEERKKGGLMFPAFIDIVKQQPKLENFDETTKHGRMSQALWEKFLANLVKNGAPAEVSFLRKVPSFLPLIGKLHEREVRSWLWMEDDIVLMDMKGRDIRRLMEADHQNHLITSGISSFDAPKARYWFVMGRFLLEDVYYRVATTNVIIDGALSEHFRNALRKNDHFIKRETGQLKADKNGSAISLRDFILTELNRIRTIGKGEVHHKNIAKLLSPETPYEKLFSFSFVKPTLWSSFNRSYKGDGYQSVPESRVISNNSFIVGVDGGIAMSLDKEKYELELGARMAFAQQSADVGADEYQRTETMDDININLTYRYKGNKRKALHPFARLEYDSEFTPTFNSNTGENNSKQKILRNVIGFGKESSLKWQVLEFGITAENDFTNSHYQYGVQGRSIGRFPLDKNWHVVYKITNNFNYYIPTKNDTDRELSFKYNMIHELLIPLYGDISLSVGADFFVFKGKTEVNSDPGMSMLMRVGVTYNRIWKPRFQSLF